MDYFISPFDRSEQILVAPIVADNAIIKVEISFPISFVKEKMEKIELFSALGVIS